MGRTIVSTTPTSSTRLGSDHETRRETTRTAECFRAHDSPAFLRLSHLRANVPINQPDDSDDDPDLPRSLDTCEKVRRSDGEPDDVGRISDAQEAIQQAITRDRDRQNRVLALILEGEVSAARRMAYCGRQSVQLECGDCGCKDNYVPITCDVRLCEDCARRRMGQLIQKYLGTVEQWSNPCLLTVTIENADDLAAVSEIRSDFGRFRDRVVPIEGETVREGERKSWCWLDDGGEPRTDYWKQSLAGSRDDRSRYQASRLEAEYVSQNRGIPVDELLRSGLYGIDVVEERDGTFNVHIHALVDALYCPQPAYSAVWEDVTGDPVVDIRTVRESDQDDREDALAEVIGYATKAPEFESVETAARYAAELKGTKMVQPFGDLHGNTPEPEAVLQCANCGNDPLWWDYLGMVDEAYDTTDAGEVNGADGDRPPDGENRVDPSAV